MAYHAHVVKSGSNKALKVKIFAFAHGIVGKLDHPELVLTTGFGVFRGRQPSY
jgi:hypothetical protein